MISTSEHWALPFDRVTSFGNVFIGVHCVFMELRLSQCVYYLEPSAGIDLECCFSSVSFPVWRK